MKFVILGGVIGMGPVVSYVPKQYHKLAKEFCKQLTQAQADDLESEVTDWFYNRCPLTEPSQAASDDEGVKEESELHVCVAWTLPGLLKLATDDPVTRSQAALMKRLPEKVTEALLKIQKHNFQLKGLTCDI